jgi:dipeptidase E
MRAVLYSDQVIAANRKVDAHLLRLLAKPAPRIGYIPSAPDPEQRFFRDKQSYYAQHRIS